MKYLLDTNVCISLINGKPASVRARFDKELGKGSVAYASSIAVFELWYGASKSSRREDNARLLAGFLSGPVSHLAFDEEDANVSGKIRAVLETAGTPVSVYDLLIAGQALRHEMILVTANVREFARIENLEWEDWTKS